MSETNKPGIEKLRESLFAALDGLKNKTMDVATAKAMSDVSQTIINSAKVEIDFQSATKRLVRSDFFAAPETLEQSTSGITPTRHGHIEVNGKSTVHRIS
jgi:hypothetical protein